MLTASRIAAGEVVERPASVVRELVDNALDAGATSIRIEIEQGGRRRIEVADDGHGIRAGEAEIAIERHATSKIGSADDLQRVSTLGFRGEALAAIASVSHLALASRAVDEPAGFELRAENGVVASLRPSGRPAGTRVAVENLFHAQPARLKFLRTDQTETAHISQLVSRYALAHPGVRFELVRDGRQLFLAPGTGEPTDALAAVLGLDVARAMIPLPGPAMPSMEDAPGNLAGIRVVGYVSPPHVHRATRRDIAIFVNGRPIHDAALAFAVVQAYRTLLPAGRYPVAVLLVVVHPAAVDVNVHPAKTEVRFRNERQVFAAVQQAVRGALLGGSSAPAAREAPLWRGEPAGRAEWRATEPTLGDREGLAPSGARELGAATSPRATDPNGDDPATPGSGESRLPALRVLGQASLAYIVAEGPDGIYLVDQHAAHERVLFDQLTSWTGGASSQLLLDPQPVTMPVSARGRTAEIVAGLSEIGFDVEPFGQDAVLVRAVPEVLAHLDVSLALRDAIELADVGRSRVAEALATRLALHVCKRAAVKSGQVLSAEEMRALLRQLEITAFPRTCPHGRPTVLVLTAERVAREFGRA